MTKQSDYQVQSGAKITCAKFGAQNFQLMATGDDQKNIYVWKLNKSLPKLSLTGHQTGVSDLTFCPRAESIFSGTYGGTVHQWDLAKKTDVAKFLGHQARITCLHYDQWGQNLLVTGSDDTKVKVWDVRMQKCVITFTQHTQRINAVALSPDSKWVASGSDDGSLKIWDIASGKIEGKFEFPGQAVTCIAFNP